MKIYAPNMQSDVRLLPDADKAESEEVGLHSHDNSSILNLFSVGVGGSLLFNSQTVGDSVKNAEAVSPLSAVDGKLVFNGLPVDTVEHRFANSYVLSNFSIVGNSLYFNGLPIGAPVDAPINEDILARLSVDMYGQLTLDGMVVSAIDSSALNTAQVVYVQLAPNTTATVNHKSVDSNRLTYVVDARMSTNPDMYEPAIVGGPASTKAEVSLTYTAGSVSSVQLKNLTAASMYLRVKVQA